jgi:hypothetical protein
MPVFSAEIGDFLQRVKDNLSSGQGRASRASVFIPVPSAPQSGIELVAKDPGVAGNLISIEVTEPAGTSGVAATISGTDITLALAVSSGVAGAPANTLALLAAELRTEAGITALVDVRVRGDASLSLVDPVAQTFAAGGLEAANPMSAPTLHGGYLRAQDFATILQLFKEAVSVPVVTATAGSTTTATVSATLAGAYVGARVVFAPATTTAALRGQEAIVVSNTGTVLTFDRTLPAAVANTDTFSLTQTFLDSSIEAFREGYPLGASPRGSVYGEFRNFINGLSLCIEQLTASDTLYAPQVSRSGLQTVAGSTETLVQVNDVFIIDQLRGLTLTVGGNTTKVVTNRASEIEVSPALPSAPGAAAAVVLSRPAVDSNPQRKHLVHPGGHPDSAYLAFLVDQVQAAIEAFVVPT